MLDKSWKRKPGESVAAYHAFEIFRDIGPRRKQRLVFNQLCLEKAMEGQPSSNGLPPAVIVTCEGDPPNPNQAQRKKISETVAGYCIKWRWHDRCREWDAFIDRQVQQRNAENYDKLREKQIKVAAAADAVNVLLMGELLRRMQTAEGRALIQGMEIKDLVKLAVESASRVKAVQEAERSANGVISKPPTEQGGVYRWILSEYQPPRPPEEVVEAAEEIMRSGLYFPDEGESPLDEP